jgi:hypothetical protein
MPQRLYESQPFPSYEDYANGGINAHMRTESKKVWLGSGAVVVPMAAHVGLFLYNCGADGWKVTCTCEAAYSNTTPSQSRFEIHVCVSVGLSVCRYWSHTTSVSSECPRVSQKTCARYTR